MDISNPFRAETGTAPRRPRNLDSPFILRPLLQISTERPRSTRAILSVLTTGKIDQ